MRPKRHDRSSCTALSRSRTTDLSVTISQQELAALQDLSPTSAIQNAPKFPSLQAIHTNSTDVSLLPQGPTSQSLSTNQSFQLQQPVPLLPEFQPPNEVRKLATFTSVLLIVRFLILG